MDKQQEVNLLIENEILGKRTSTIFHHPGWLNNNEWRERRGEHLKFRLIRGDFQYRDMIFCNEPLISIGDKEMTNIECYDFMVNSTDSGKYCVIKDFIFVFQGDSPGKSSHYNEISKMKVRVDDQIIIIETGQKYN